MSASFSTVARCRSAVSVRSQAAIPQTRMRLSACSTEDRERRTEHRENNLERESVGAGSSIGKKKRRRGDRRKHRPASSVPFQAATRSFFSLRRKNTSHSIAINARLVETHASSLSISIKKMTTHASASSSSVVAARAAAKPARVAAVAPRRPCCSHSHCRQHLRGSLVLARAEEENQATAGAEMEVRFFLFFFSSD